MKKDSQDFLFFDEICLGRKGNSTCFSLQAFYSRIGRREGNNLLALLALGDILFSAVKSDTRFPPMKMPAALLIFFQVKIMLVAADGNSKILVRASSKAQTST